MKFYRMQPSVLNTSTLQCKVECPSIKIEPLELPVNPGRLLIRASKAQASRVLEGEEGP